jgi:hypothetical protein
MSYPKRVEKMFRKVVFALQIILAGGAQSRKSARLSLQTSEKLAPPAPSPQASVAPPPGSKEGGTHERGQGEPIPAKGLTFWHSIVMV